LSSPLKYLFSFLFFGAISALLLLGFLSAYVNLPSGPKGVIEVRVDRRENFATVAARLKKHKVIANERLFVLWARLWSLDRRIRWGIYRFELPSSPHNVLKRMILGQGAFRRVTVPEGLTVREIADLFDREGIADKAQLLAANTDSKLLARLGLTGKSLEGYLFPDTYHFTPLMGPHDLLAAMKKRFDDAVGTLAVRDNGLGLSVHEVVTLASLIEKESGVEDERPLISAVFHNRLKQKMPLQSDPTVIYGLKKFSGNLTRNDLQRPGPYNTYRIQGLPPGPICNPGLSALRAAILPAQVPYLYFVSKNDGSHLFSSTIADHDRAVERFQKKRSSRR
jgi:UPF0755 protein